MRLTFIVLMAVVLWLPTHVWSGGGAEDRKLIEGTWLPVEGELAGRKLPDEILKSLKLTISGDKYSAEIGKQIEKGAIKLVPTASPKTVDTTPADGPNKGKTIPAIYELSGDTLRVCYDLSGINRPTEFKTDQDSKHLLLRYQREKR